jgi:RNA polymerase sigma-70 factor (ECF subfamily)
MSQKTWAAAAVTFGLGVLSFGCQSGGIGDPCTPEDEYQQFFSGYEVTEAENGQDALAKLCVKIGQFRGEAALSTWLHRLTVNACRDVVERRATRRFEPLAEDTRVALEPSPSREAELAELRAELRAGLAGIPSQQARVLVLKDALGFSFREISNASGMPVGTAKCYAHRGRAGMRSLLEDGAAA